jgi:hypothetical protein
VRWLWRPFVGLIRSSQISSPRQLQFDTVKRRLQASDASRQSEELRQRQKKGDKRSKKTVVLKDHQLFVFLRDPIVDAKLLDPLFTCPESAPLLRKAMHHFNLSWKQHKKSVAKSRRLQELETAAKTTIAKPIKTPHSRIFPNVAFSSMTSPLSFLFVVG